MSFSLGLGLTTAALMGGDSLAAIIAALFGAGEPGAVWLPEPKYLYQDRAGTTPVTAPGQSVGMRLDVSGRGNHLVAINDAARGVYQTDGTLHWIQYDGADDGYVSPVITPGTDKAQVFAGVRKLSDAAPGMVVELSQNSGGNAGSFYVAAPEDSSVRYASLSRGTAPSATAQRANFTSVGAAPDTAVITATHDISGARSTIRRNGVAGTNATGDKGTGNFGAYPLYVGRRGGVTLPFNGRDYGFIARFGPNLSAPVIAQVERYLAQRTGVSI